MHELLSALLAMPPSPPYARRPSPLPPSPPPSSPVRGWCADGIIDGTACCPKPCGQCGGVGCGSAPGGRAQCCKGELLSGGASSCADDSSTACVVPIHPDVDLLPLLTQPRSGSSLLMSLIGESNQVIELQEMFNCFSHAPAQRDLIRFFGKALLANESAGHRAVNDAVNNNPNGAVEVAARCAEVFGKHAVAFKSFHPGELRQNGQDLSQLFANYGRGERLL